MSEEADDWCSRAAGFMGCSILLDALGRNALAADS